jgi:hypothetical protein
MGEVRNAYKFLLNCFDLHIDGRIMLKPSKKIGWEGVDWIHLAQNRDQWWTFVNTLTSCQVF